MSSGVCLLHVEDDPGFADLTADALESRYEGFEVVTAGRPAEALDKLAERQFDCVVSDYDMPGRTGIEFLEAVRDEWADLPFILFTGKGSETVASEAMSKGATDYLQKNSGTEQYDLLANRVRNAVEQYRAVRRAEEHERISSLVRRIDSALVRAGSTAEIERKVCEILTSAEPYAAACIAGVDTDTMRVNPRTWAGQGSDYFAGLEMHIDADSDGHDAPSGRAFHNRTVAVSQDIQSDQQYERWRSAATERGFRSLAVIPLEYEETLYGLLAVFSSRPSAFDETERQMLSEVGEDIAHAFHAREIQAELRATETRFRALTDNTDTIVLTIDDTSTIRYVNDAVKHVLGYQPEELIGESLYAIMPDRFHDRHEAGVARYLESGTKQLDWDWIEFPGLDADGQEVSLGVSFGEATVRGDHRFTAVLRDITDSEEHKRSLERTQRRFEAILDSPDSLIGILDPDGTLRRANQTAVDLVEASRDELAGQPFWETPYWTHSAELQRRLREWVQQAADGDHVRFEADHPTADGDDIVVDGVLRPVTNSIGDVISIIVEARDVTELKERERELAAQRSRLKQLNRINETLRAVHRELVGATDREELEAAICTSLTKTDVYDGAWIGRYEPETERIRPTAWTGVDDDHMQTLEIRTDDTRKGNGPGGRAVRRSTVEAVRNIKDGDQIQPWRSRLQSLGIDSLAAIPIVHGDTVYGVVGVYASRPGVFGDDERAALAEVGQAIGNAFDSIETQAALERQNERLNEFAGVVSHDLRNPLQVAQLRLEMVRSDVDHDQLPEVTKAHDRMEALIDDLLALSREGRSVDNVELVDLNGLILDCWDTVATTDASITVETEQTIQADRNRLRQLLENVFRNAVEHGGERVTITVGERSDGFYIADDGPGIPVDERDNVFESGYSTSADGTGFGLSIVKEIAKAHGWEISVTEADGGGARFEITGIDCYGAE